MLTAIALYALTTVANTATAETVHDLRVAKCEYLWARANPKTVDPALCEWFVECHRRAGIESRWYYSFIYCWSGSDLNPRMRSGDTLGGYHARGLVDTLWSTHSGNLPWVRSTVESRGLKWGENVLHDPYVAVRLHIIELQGCYDANGWRTMRRVFLPKSPDGPRAMREQSRRWIPRHDKCVAWMASPKAPRLSN